MLKKIFLGFCMLSLFFASAQKEANIWYFGEYAGLDFNSGNPVALLNGQLNTLEGCATISDKDGSLLFYTDGITVWDKNHNIMPNGTGLLGNSSSVSSGLVVPNNSNANIYYLFTNDFEGYSYGFRFSVIDLSLNGGLGDVTSEKNVSLFTPPSAESVSAVRHANGTDYWVLAHGYGNNTFYAYLVTGLGVNTTPITTNIGDPVANVYAADAVTFSKISPDGTKIAFYQKRDTFFNLFNFNTTTGKLSNAVTIGGINATNTGVVGIEFSPNSKYLYINDYLDGIYQYDVSDYNYTSIFNSKVSLPNSPQEYLGPLQLGPDGKIYVARFSETFLGRINEPNKIGALSDFVNNAIDLNGRKCFFGLPTFIQSYFKVSAFDHDNTCFGDITTFKLSDTVDSIVWDFGDPASGVNNTSTDFEPTHVFTSPGTYKVTVTATSGGETDTNEQDVIIYELPTVTQPTDLLVCDDNNDGFYNFDLTQQDIAILNGQDATVFEVNYYASIADYTSNSPILNATIYVNTLAYAQENIIASIRNRNNIACDDITSFNILVFESPMPNQNISKISLCDNTSFGTDDDGRIQFDLTQKENDILNGQLLTGFDVKYYTDEFFLDEIATPSNYVNTNALETIYVQVSNRTNPLCMANTRFDIEVLELPITTAIVDLKQCDNDLDGFSYFNLNEVIAEITINAISETITFHETLAEANSGNNAISNTITYINEVVSNDVIWARIENNSGCFKTTQVNLIVSTTQIPLTYTRDFYECDDDLDGDSTNGISAFDFSSVNSEIEAIFPVGQQLIINYYRNEADALAETNPILDISNYRNNGYPNTQNIYIRVDSAVDNDCIGFGSHITLHVEKQPVAHPVTIPEQCDADGDTMYAFDTTNIESIILNGQIGMAVSYIDELGNTLPSPLPNPFLTATQTITARVTNATSQDPDGACFDETNIEFKVEAASVAYTINDIIECDDDNNDGQFPFDTSNIETTVLNGQTGMIVTYTDELGNTLPSPLPNPFISSSQSITVRVENPLSSTCYDETAFNLVVVEQPVLNMSDTWLICAGDFVEIIADSGYDEYQWSTGETLSSIIVYNSGTYEVTATNTFAGMRCEASKSVSVIESNMATITNIETKDWTQNDNVISVFVEGLGDYEYSLDDITYQDSNTFNNLKIDNYTVYVRDKKGCGISTQEVFLMYYPKFFTPNNDGYHDTWAIYNSNLEANNKIYIYDRYGKLLKQLNPNTIGWDGTINGEMMPTSDYWFVVHRQNGKTYKGHFALKR